MAKVQLRALKPQRYGTRHLEAGDLFEADPKQVRILTAIKRAELVEGAQTPTRAPVTRHVVTRPTPEANPAPAAMTTRQAPSAKPAQEPEPEPADEEEEEYEAAPEDEEPAAEGTEYDDMTRGELLAEVRQRGLKLPSGYVSQPALVALLRDATV